MYNLDIVKTKLDGVFSIAPITNFEDHRGSYIEIYNKEIYANAGIDQDFIQDDISISRQNVLRGIHGDEKTWKLVSCLLGSIYLIVVNNDISSEQYREWEGFTISSRNYRQILIPPNFGVGHLVLSSNAIFHYKQSTLYQRETQFTIKWDDPNYKFWWPICNPITSIRDQV